MIEIRREYPIAPLVGVGAVIIEARKVLLIKREHEPNLGKWSIPGGLVELGETIRDACKREIIEEVGYSVELFELLDAIDNIRRDDQGRIRFHYIVMDFLARPITQVNPNPEHKEMKWFTKKEALNLDLTATARKLLEDLNF